MPRLPGRVCDPSLFSKHLYTASLRTGVSDLRLPVLGLYADQVEKSCHMIRNQPSIFVVVINHSKFSYVTDTSFPSRSYLVIFSLTVDKLYKHNITN